MKSACLKDKISDENYVNGLSDKRRKELLFCGKLLNENELGYLSSIDIGYRIARDRYVRDVLYKQNKELAEKILEGKKIPIFTIFDNLGENVE